MEFSGERFGVEGTFQRAVWFQEYQGKVGSRGERFIQGFLCQVLRVGGAFCFKQAPLSAEIRNRCVEGEAGGRRGEKEGAKGREGNRAGCKRHQEAR